MIRTYVVTSTSPIHPPSPRYIAVRSKEGLRAPTATADNIHWELWAASKGEPVKLLEVSQMASIQKHFRSISYTLLVIRALILWHTEAGLCQRIIPYLSLDQSSLC